MSIDLPILRIIQGTRPNPSAACYKRLEQLTGVRMLPPIEQLIETAMKAAEQDKTRHLHSSPASPSAKRARRGRRLTLATALKQATKAGQHVSGAVLAPDGNIELKFGHSKASTQADDPWAAEIARLKQ